MSVDWGFSLLAPLRRQYRLSSRMTHQFPQVRERSQASRENENTDSWPPSTSRWMPP